MKHLFFVAVAGGIFSGATLSVKAQTNTHIERSVGRAHPNITPKFIEGIEISAAPITNSITIAEETIGSTQITVAGSPVIKPGFTSSIEVGSPLQFKYAMMLNREVESITNFSLYNFIDNWLDTRYQYGGTDSNGIDCSAFTCKLLSEVYGLAVPRTAKDQYKICEKQAIEDLAEGDLVFFNTRGGISHVGLYLGNNYFVHSSVHDGVTISSLTDDYYSRKFISGGSVMLPPAQGTGPFKNTVSPQLSNVEL